MVYLLFNDKNYSIIFTVMKRKTEFIHCTI